MSSIQQTIMTRLTSDVTVAALIVDRIYPEYELEADKTYPAAVYKVENVTTQMASDGPTGLRSCDYVVAAISPSYDDASDLADAIQTALDGAVWSDGSINVQGSFLKDDGREEDVVTIPDSEQLTLYVVTLTFLVWYAAA